MNALSARPCVECVPDAVTRARTSRSAATIRLAAPYLVTLTLFVAAGGAWLWLALAAASGMGSAAGFGRPT